MLIPLGIGITPAFPQSNQSATAPSRPGALGWESARNKWRLTPAMAAEQRDTVSPEVRAARNSYLQPRLAVAANFNSPLISINYSRRAVDPKSTIANGGIWVVGTFEGSHVYSADNAGALLYTEENIRVKRVIYQAPSSKVSANALLDVVEYGGRLITPDGETHTSRLDPKRYSLEPSRQYILELLPGSNGYYVATRVWDVTGGKVMPSSVIDEEQVRKGKSQIVGLSEDAAIAYIESAMAADK